MDYEPLTLDSLLKRDESMSGFVPPSGGFNPDYGWEHHYRIWLFEGDDKGVLKLKCSRTYLHGASDLVVEKKVFQSQNSAHLTNAEILFSADAVSTPKQWHLESVIMDPDSVPIEKTRIEKTAVVAGDEIRVTVGEHTFFRPAPDLFTIDWLLFDMVQRLPGSSLTPMEFDLLEASDLLKEGQRLSYRESRVFEVNGYTLPLIGYHIIGGGILPHQFWVDDKHRLLFVFSGPRAFILDHAVAEVFHEKWSSAEIPQEFNPGTSGTVAGADSSWTYALEPAAGPLAIAEEGGNRRLESTGGGGRAAHGLASFLSNDVSIDFGSVESATIKATVLLKETAPEDERRLRIMVHNDEASITGLGVYFNANTARSALTAHVYIDGVKSSVFCGGAGDLTPGETYLITVTFTRNASSTVIDYHVGKASGGDLIPPRTQTIPDAAVPEGVPLNTMELSFEKLMACAVDDIIVQS